MTSNVIAEFKSKPMITPESLMVTRPYMGKGCSCMPVSQVRVQIKVYHLVWVYFYTKVNMILNIDMNYQGLLYKGVLFNLHMNDKYFLYTNSCILFNLDMNYQYYLLFDRDNE